MKALFFLFLVIVSPIFASQTNDAVKLKVCPPADINDGVKLHKDPPMEIGEQGKPLSNVSPRPTYSRPKQSFTERTSVSIWVRFTVKRW